MQRWHSGKPDMQLFFDNVQDTKGNAIVDANVIVTNYPSGTTAIIYDENDAIPANEIVNLVTDAQGQYQFFAPNGRYSITIKKNTITLDEIIDFEISEAGSGGSIAVTDGTTTVDPTNVLNFGLNYVVTTPGGQQANVNHNPAEDMSFNTGTSLIFGADTTAFPVPIVFNGSELQIGDSNENIRISGGLVTLENGIVLEYTQWPGSDGSPDQVLTTNGAGQLTWETPSSGGGVDSVIGGANVSITGTATDPVVNVPFIGVENINAGDNVTITGAATNPVINVPNLGPDTFLELDDTPALYTGFGLQSVRVNAGETGLQFAPFPDTGVASVVAGTNVTVDATDPANPVINVPDVGIVDSIVAGTGIGVDDTDPANPIVNVTQLAITDTFVVASEAAMLALSAQMGDVAVRTDINTTYILQQDPPTILANWVELLSPGQVVSVNGQTGTVSLGFIDLDDTPADYTGAAGQAVVVNGGESGLEFIPFPASGIDIAQDGVVQAAGATEIDFLVNFDVSLAGEVSHKPDAFMGFANDFGLSWSGGSLAGGVNYVEASSPQNVILRAGSPGNQLGIFLNNVSSSDQSLGFQFNGSSSSDFFNASWNGTDTTVALQHNGSDVFVVDEASCRVVNTFFDVGPRGGNHGVVRIIRNTGAVMATFGGFVSLDGQGAIWTIEGESGESRISLTNTSGDKVFQITGNTNLPIVRVESYGALGEERMGWFNATPIPQPILTSGTQQELIAALGSTSGLGLVDDSAAAAWVPVVTTPEVVDSNNSNSYAPVNPQRKVTYLIDTLTDGAQTTHMQPDDWEPGDIIRFVDYESNFSSDSFTIDFESHNFEGTGSATLVMSVDDGAITLEYIDATRGFQRISVV
jgi:hypothetical protein